MTHPLQKKGSCLAPLADNLISVLFRSAPGTLNVKVKDYNLSMTEAVLTMARVISRFTI